MCVSDCTSFTKTASYKPGFIIFARGFRKAHKWRGFYLRGLIGNRKRTSKQAIAQHCWSKYIVYILLVLFKLYKGPLSRLAHSFCLECQLLVLIHYVTEEIFSEWQNHSFLSNKYVSQALFQTLQATEMNFEKLLA